MRTIILICFVGMLSFHVMAQADCHDCGVGPICSETPEERDEENRLVSQGLKRIEARWRKQQKNNGRDFGDLPVPGPWTGDPIQGTLIWPLIPSDDVDDFSYFYISQYQDLDSVGNDNLLDYNCGEMTYDSDGAYDHDGIDIVTYPYPYNKMSNNEVNVVAVADGIIVCKINGNSPDDNCRRGTGRPRNRIILVHFDGTITQYGHLKAGSFTSKNEMDTVLAGEYLGQVGSSGNSSIPHLHFEVKDSMVVDQDPFFGPCSNQSNIGGVTTSSWWADQISYEHPLVNALYTHDGMPTLWSCDDSDSTGVPGIMRRKTYFEPGDSIVFGGYYRHTRDTYDSEVTIYRPDNSIWKTYDDDEEFDGGFQKRQQIFHPEALPINALHGVWRYRVTFEGEIFEVEFYVTSCPAIHSLVGVVDDVYYRKASQKLSSSQTLINSGQTDVIYQAGDEINLNLGFEIFPGALFETRLTNCDDLPDGN